MKLEEYNTFKEKTPFFNNGDVKIDININSVFDTIGKFQKDGGSFIYRGCSEAKHKMYCSAQRLYMNRELHKQVKPSLIKSHYRKFITELIESCKKWNNGVVKKLLIQSGIDENNTLAYLSYMQHFGVPTPLLDFTFNPYVALFFAVDNIQYLPSDNEIDNYFSLYYTYSDAYVFDSWKYVFDKSLEKKSISYESIEANCMNILLPENELYKIMNSVNIINQEGLFFYNNHPWYPLERTYNDYVTSLKKDLGKKIFDDLVNITHKNPQWFNSEEIQKINSISIILEIYNSSYHFNISYYFIY